MIVYREEREFRSEDLERLFLPVHWRSGNYPEKLQRGLRNSSQVISAWDGDRLVGLVRGLDDGETVGFVHYLLVDPAYQGRGIATALMERLMERYQHLLHVKLMPSNPDTVPFYEKFGFRRYDKYTALELENL